MTTQYSAYDVRFIHLLAVLWRVRGSLDPIDREVVAEAREWYYRHRAPKSGRPRKLLPPPALDAKPEFKQALKRKETRNGKAD